jgi:hypothetical protein
MSQNQVVVKKEIDEKKDTLPKDEIKEDKTIPQP